MIDFLKECVLLGEEEDKEKEIGKGGMLLYEWWFGWYLMVEWCLMIEKHKNGLLLYHELV